MERGGVEDVGLSKSHDLMQPLPAAEEVLQVRFPRFWKTDLPGELELGSFIDQVNRAAGKPDHGQIVRQNFRKQTLDALAWFQETLRRAGEHRNLRALGGAATRQIDAQPRLTVELAHHALFVSGLETLVVRRRRRRRLVQALQQNLHSL